MASTTEFILKWISDVSGLQNTVNYMKKAEAESRSMATQLTKDAKFITANTTRAWNQQGKAIDTTTSMFSQSGQQFAVTTRNIGGNVEFMKASLKSSVPIVGQVVSALRRAVIVAPIWNAFRFAYTQVLQLITSSLKFIADWEYQLAQIRIVANDSEEAIQNLSYSLLSLSKNLGISTKDLGEGAKLYAQQGRSIKEIIPLMDATAKLSLLSGRTMVQSVEDMTAVLKAYNFEANQATQVIDAISKVMLVHAIDADDLAGAYKSVASTASSLGVSFEALTGYITAIKSVTRDAGSKIGESLRTMFSRITAVSAEAIQRLTGIPLFLNESGQVTNTVTANFRDLDIVIAELANAFKGLGSAQQSELSQLVGGTRRINQVMALFNNFTEATEAQATAMFSLGEADKAIAVLTDTVRLRMERLTGSWQQFVQSISDTSGFKSFLGSLSESIEGVTLFVNRVAFVRDELKKNLDELQKQATYQELFAQQVGKATEKIEGLVESMKAGRLPVEELRLEVGLLINALNAKGLQFNFQIENMDDPIRALEELKRRASEVRALEVQAKIQIQRRDLQKQLVDVSSDIEKVVNTQTDKFDKLNGAVRGLGTLLNKIRTGNLKQISEDLALKGTPEKLAQIQKAMDKLLKTPEERKSFGELLTQFDQIAQSIQKTDTLEKQAIDAIAKREKETQSAKLATILTEEQVKIRIQGIEEQATVSDKERLDVVKEELALLNSSQVILDEELENKRDQLTLEELRLTKAEERRAIETRYLKIATDLKQAGASNLQLLINEKAYLEAINAVSEKRVENERKIYDARKQLESTTTQTLLGVQSDLLKMQGLTDVQVIEATMQMEEQLGIERKGLDALKQKLDLIKAITKEQELSKEDRLKELEALVKTTKLQQNPRYQARLQQREKILTGQAEALGISKEKIEQILKVPTLEENVKILGQQLTIDLPTELQKLSDPLNTNLFQLTDAIKYLTNALVNEAVRQTPQLPTNIPGVTATQIAPPGATKALPNITTGRTIGGGMNTLVEVNVGDKNVYLNTGLTDKELQDKVQSIIGEEDQIYISRITRRIGEMIRTPESDIYKAIQQNIEEF